MRWSSRFAFIMASVGFAVGLGNIWRFPYVTGENGGSAFVVIYLLCAVAIGIPCLMAELLVGRRGGGSRPPPWPPLPPNLAGAIAGKSLAAWAWSLPIHCHYLRGGRGLGALVPGPRAAHRVTDFDARRQNHFAGLLADNQSMVMDPDRQCDRFIYAGVTAGIERAVTL